MPGAEKQDCYFWKSNSLLNKCQFCAFTIIKQYESCLFLRIKSVPGKLKAQYGTQK